MDYLSIIAVIVPAVALVVIFYKYGTNKAAKESNEILRGLIDDQRDEILKLREKLHGHGNDIQNLQLSLGKLTGENKTLRELLQGRDENTVLFQKQGFEAMKRSEEIFKLSMETNKNVEKLYRVIEKYLNIMEKKI